MENDGSKSLQNETGLIEFHLFNYPATAGLPYRIELNVELPQVGLVRQQPCPNNTSSMVYSVRVYFRQYKQIITP